MNKPYRVFVQVERRDPHKDPKYTNIYELDLGTFATESEAVELADKLEIAALPPITWRRKP